MRLYILLLALVVGSVQAADIRVVWTAPTTCKDGSALTGCPTSGYEVQEQISDGAWVIKQGVAATTLAYTATAVPIGQKRCYRIRTNSNGNFSDPSVTGCATIPTVTPGSPTNVTVTVTISVE